LVLVTGISSVLPISAQFIDNFDSKGSSVIDSEVVPDKSNKSFFTISYPVLQRLIEGKTLGLAISPLDAVNAAFYSSENENGKFAATLHFDLERDP